MLTRFLKLSNNATLGTIFGGLVLAGLLAWHWSATVAAAVAPLGATWGYLTATTPVPRWLLFALLLVALLVGGAVTAACAWWLGMGPWAVPTLDLSKVPGPLNAIQRAGLAVLHDYYPSDVGLNSMQDGIRERGIEASRAEIAREMERLEDGAVVRISQTRDSYSFTTLGRDWVLDIAGVKTVSPEDRVPRVSGRGSRGS